MTEKMAAIEKELAEKSRVLAPANDGFRSIDGGDSSALLSSAFSLGQMQPKLKTTEGKVLAVTEALDSVGSSLGT